MAVGSFKLPNSTAAKDGPPPDRFRTRVAVLEESAMVSRTLERFPIWITVEGSETVQDAFNLLLCHLREKGHCYQDVQSDPHPNFGLATYFQVSLREEGMREPELLGTVSLYADKKEPFLIKISPESPAYSAVFMETVEAMVEQLIEKRGADGTVDLDIKIAQKPNFETK